MCLGVVVDYMHHREHTEGHQSEHCVRERFSWLRKRGNIAGPSLIFWFVGLSNHTAVA